MALKKGVPTNFGVDAQYWKIGEVLENFLGNSSQIILYGYVDAAAREAGKQALSSAQIQLTGDDYQPDCDRAALYEKIKALEPWADAESC